MSIFVVDSNFFIEAHRATYPLDVAPSFWNKVKYLADSSKICSIDKVKSELSVHQDDLERWCAANLSDDFFKESSTCLSQYSQIAKWAQSRSGHYLPQAISDFLHADEADAFLIAFTLADPSNRILVTQEVANPLQKNRIKIPDVCKALGVTCCNTVEMFRKLGETF
ncbi:MAG: DUF4411 family protein [Bacteroidetes bacterium]|nr:DUF4411 family protein [Bacteroidota bacterium]